MAWDLRLESMSMAHGQWIEMITGTFSSVKVANLLGQTMLVKGFKLVRNYGVWIWVEIKRMK